MPSKNTIIVAAAGSGKTTGLVAQVLNNPDERVLIATYTINNVTEIEKKFFAHGGIIPKNVSVTSWFTFLLQDLVRPYQNYVRDVRIDGMAFSEGRSAKYVSKTDVERYYLLDSKTIFSDKVSEFGMLCNEKSDGLVIQRIEELYDHIYIDEVQDLAGYDLDLVELLLKSKCKVTLVGDHRQATFQTNTSSRNKKYSGIGIIDKFEEWKSDDLCDLIYSQESHRCNQFICDFANSLYPKYPGAVSVTNVDTDHDGVFVISSKNVREYIETFHPQVLRYDVRAKCFGYESMAMNWGESKGLTFDRVLIIPHGQLGKALKTGDLSLAEGSLPKLYVAVTRARFSVAFVYDGETKLSGLEVYDEEADVVEVAEAE